MGADQRAEARKDAIIARLIEARACILAAVSSLPTDRQDDVFLGVWSVKDLLAHLVGWDFANIEAAEAVLAGSLPSFYAHRDRGWRTYNAGLVARYRQDDLAALVRSVEQSHQALIAFLSKVDSEAFDRDMGLRAGRFKVTIARLLDAEAQDELTHCRQVRAFVERGGASEGEEP